MEPDGVLWYYVVSKHVGTLFMKGKREMSGKIKMHDSLKVIKWSIA